MIRIITYGLLVMLFIFLQSFAIADNNSSQVTNQGLISTKEAKCPEQNTPPFISKCSFSLSNNQYIIDPRGMGTRLTANGIKETFTVPIELDDHIEDLRYALYNGDLILIYGVSDYESGGGIVIRLDGKSLSVKWKLSIPGFNLSDGVIEDIYLYQAAIGFVSKINLEKGIYAWKHNNLYDRDKYSFGAFQEPMVTETEIIFRELKQSVAKYEKTRVIRVNKDKGTINIE